MSRVYGKYIKYHLVDNSPVPDNTLAMLMLLGYILVIQPIFWVTDIYDRVVKKYRIFNFMLVGGIGYIINMAVYCPLMLVFKSDVTFLNTHFYLPPFLISTFIAATSNYLMNKVWTFKDKERYKQSYIRYLLACSVTVLFDIVLLFILVDYGHLYPMLAAALAILVMFIARYFVVKKWVWKG